MIILEPYSRCFTQHLCQSEHFLSFMFRYGADSFIVTDIALFTETIQLVNQVSASANSKGKGLDSSVVVRLTPCPVAGSCQGSNRQL
jgi:hypothetical protein